MASDPFDRIVLEYQDRVVRYLNGILGDAALAHDLAQETFLRVHASMEGPRESGASTPWIFRIAHNAAIDHLRSRTGRQSSLTRSLDEPSSGAEEIEDCSCASADNRLDEAEMSACMRSYIKELPPLLRECLILRDLEGLGEQAVSEILGRSPNVVKVRTHRARRMLRAKLHEQCGFYQDERGVLRCEPADHSDYQRTKGT